MSATEERPNAVTQKCSTCGESLAPRGLRAPRFCPRCGLRLSDPPYTYGVDSNVPRRSVSGAAVTALVLGILGIIIPFGCLPFGVPALVVGALASHRVKRSSGQLEGDGMATAGMILGVISIILWSGALCIGALH